MSRTPVTEQGAQAFLCVKEEVKTDDERRADSEEAR